jgi:iron complex outermembrane receptor protein
LNWQSGQWQADLHAFRYSAQRRVADYESSTDGYWLIDAEVSSTPAIAAGRLQVFVKLDNLTDATGRRHTSPLKDYVPLPARSLGAGLRWEF